ncbi:MAG: hypothetical protein EBR47_12115, partial [Betaproteobacteria bacterium]|nr:hypothetical protein [Betaproteobacteria bacterium]
SFKADAMNMTAEMPLTLASFLAILALMAFARGVCSAATKFFANEATSTPEPEPKEEIICCALALFAAVIWSAVITPLAVELLVVDNVLPVEAVVVAVLDETEVVGIDEEIR